MQSPALDLGIKIYLCPQTHFQKLRICPLVLLISSLVLVKSGHKLNICSQKKFLSSVAMLYKFVPSFFILIKKGIKLVQCGHDLIKLVYNWICCGHDMYIVFPHVMCGAPYLGTVDPCIYFVYFCFFKHIFIDLTQNRKTILQSIQLKKSNLRKDKENITNIYSLRTILYLFFYYYNILIYILYILTSIEVNNIIIIDFYFDNGGFSFLWKYLNIAVLFYCQASYQRKRGATGPRGARRSPFPRDDSQSQSRL